MDLKMYHFHDVDPKQKEHIKDCESDSGNALCGHYHPTLSGNGDTITLEWAMQNIPYAADSGSLCKRCARIAMNMLEDQAITTRR